MRIAARQRAARPTRQALVRGETSLVKSIAAPTRGWVASENESDLPEKTAGTMINWYPEPESVRLRPGSSEHAALPRAWAAVAADSPNPLGVHCEGTTAFLVDNAGKDVVAYNLYTGERVETLDFDLDADNSAPRGIWGDGITLWVSDSDDDKLYAYTQATGARDAAKDIDTSAVSTNLVDMWSDGTTIWVVNSDATDSLFAFTLATGARDAAKDITLDAVNASPSGVWSDGTTVWVSDRADAELYAYVLSTGSRDGSKDITCVAENSNPFALCGMTAGLDLIWCLDIDDDALYIYEAATGDNFTDPGDAETLFSYHAGASQNLFAAAGGYIFDVTSESVALSHTDLGGNDYVTVNFATAAGQFLVACNGEDHPVNFDGSTWQATPAITGVTAASLTSVVAYQQRLYFIEKNSASVWYLSADSIGGSASELALGGLLTKGGSIIAGTTWTIDAGEGPDDYLVFMSSEGEVLIYYGTDPSSSSSFSFVGKFFSGRPLGRHCLLNIGTDVIALTTDGLLSLARTITTDRTASDRGAFTDRIEKAFNEAFRIVGNVAGWQTITYPKLNMAIVNVPVVAGLSYEQYAMNVLTGAWCRFQGMNAFHWAALQDNIYFSEADGRIKLFDDGADDSGTAIQGTIIGAYDDFGHPGRIKHAVSGQAFFQANRQATIGIGFARDFKDPGQVSQTTPTVPAGASTWDTALWDTATWSAEGDTVAIERVAGNVVGHRIAVVITIDSAVVIDASEPDIRFNSINVLYMAGGIVG